MTEFFDDPRVFPSDAEIEEARHRRRRVRRLGTGQHEPTEACLSKHCFFHHVDEPGGETAYVVCGECFHVYVTPEDLVTLATRPEAFLFSESIPKASEIYVCPLCAHEF